MSRHTTNQRGQIGRKTFAKKGMMTPQIPPSCRQSQPQKHTLTHYDNEKAAEKGKARARAKARKDAARMISGNQSEQDLQSIPHPSHPPVLQEKVEKLVNASTAENGDTSAKIAQSQTEGRSSSTRSN